jgi:hypothetical protein
MKNSATPGLGQQMTGIEELGFAERLGLLVVDLLPR